MTDAEILGRSEYKTIIAPASVVTKVERYKKSRRLPSNSQALAAMTEEIEKRDSLLQLFQVLLERLNTLVSGLQDAGGAVYQAMVKAFAELLQVVMQQVNIQLRAREQTPLTISGTLGNGTDFCCVVDVQITRSS